MDSQHSYYYAFQQGSKPRHIPKQRAHLLSAASRMSLPASADMMVTLSDQSTHSTRSGYTDATDLSVPSLSTMSSSYDDPLPSFDYETGHSPSYVPAYSAASSFGPGSYGQASPTSFSRYDHERRETPSSLGWSRDSVLVELYNFVVLKGKEPYLELLSNYRVTTDTPKRVYLDTPRDTPKGMYPCQFPGCPTKKPFNRPADLDRHYRNVHAPAEQKERYQCDYPKCERATEPFTRKDHYRDHLRDYHKEDLGQAKRAKKEDRQKWERAQESWLAERNISINWWRCAKCLSRVRVEDDGWECSRCNGTCEPDRAARRQMKSEDYVMHTYDAATDLSQSSCTACSGTMYVHDGNAGWESCPKCSLRTAPEYSYAQGLGDDLAYDISGSYDVGYPNY